MKISQEVQIAMDICLKIPHLVILCFTPKTTTTNKDFEVKFSYQTKIIILYN